MCIRDRRINRALFGLVTVAAVLYPLQAVIGAFQVWTQLAPWTQTLHVALATFIWVAAVAAVFVSYYSARVRVSEGAPSPGPCPASDGRRHEGMPSGTPGAVAGSSTTAGASIAG